MQILTFPSSGVMHISRAPSIKTKLSPISCYRCLHCVYITYLFGGWRRWYTYQVFPAFECTTSTLLSDWFYETRDSTTTSSFLHSSLAIQLAVACRVSSLRVDAFDPVSLLWISSLRHLCSAVAVLLGLNYHP